MPAWSYSLLIAVVSAGIATAGTYAITIARIGIAVRDEDRADVDPEPRPDREGGGR